MFGLCPPGHAGFPWRPGSDHRTFGRWECRATGEAGWI